MRVNAWLIGKINNIPRGLPTDNSQKINILYFLDLFLDCIIYRLSLKYFFVIDVSKIQKALPTFAFATSSKRRLEGENWK